MINTVHQGDCIELMKLIPDNSIDMVLCDLPYGTTKCKWDTIIPFEPLWGHYRRIIKDSGAIVLTSSQPFTSALIMSNPNMFKYQWIWEKSKATGFLNAKKRPLVAHEEILIFCKISPPYYPIMESGNSYDKGVRKTQTENDVYGNFKQHHVKSKGNRYPRTVKYFKTAESEGKTFHKSQKPIALFEYLIKTYTKEGDLVLDNCAGSGTTGIACQNTNRNYILIEQIQEYYEIINKRLEDNKAKNLYIQN